MTSEMFFASKRSIALVAIIDPGVSRRCFRAIFGQILFFVAYGPDSWSWRRLGAGGGFQNGVIFGSNGSF